MCENTPTNTPREVSKIGANFIKNNYITALMAKGNKGRGKAFSAADLEILFQLLEERLPMGPDQWDLLAADYNLIFHNTNKLS